MIAFWRNFKILIGHNSMRIKVAAVHYLLSVLLTLACYLSTIVGVSVTSPLFSD